MEKKKYIILKDSKKLAKKDYNNKKFIIYILIILLIFILFLICNIIIEKKLFLKEKLRLEKDREIFEKNIMNKEYYFYRYLCPKEVIGKKKVLYGNYGDGGYVLLDDLTDIKIAYSFGISNIISFDKALADKGIDVYMYDHTINGLPFDDSKFHWKKIGLTGERERGKNLPNLKTLKELLVENGHTQEKNMILKIDVENNEWDTLNEITDDILRKFKYIIMEFHFWDIDKKYNLYLNCMKHLMKFHQIFHIHCCNCVRLLIMGDNPICNTIEVSYIKREGNEFKKDESIYPVKGLEYKICNKKPSMDLEPNILKYCDNL